MTISEKAAHLAVLRRQLHSLPLGPGVLGWYLSTLPKTRTMKLLAVATVVAERRRRIASAIAVAAIRKAAAR